MSELYGKSGIDTPYERKRFEYKPDIIYPEKELGHHLHSDVSIEIERARKFKVSSVMICYRELIEKIEAMMKVIEERNPEELFMEFKEAVVKDSKKANEIEKKMCTIEQTNDYEAFYTLYVMKKSLQVRFSFLDEYYRTQITDKVELEEVMEVEDQSITAWFRIEEKIASDHNHDHDHDHDGREIREDQESLEFVLKQRRELESFHTSMADMSFIHFNRYEMFKSLIQRLEILVYRPQALVSDGLAYMMQQFKDFNDYSAVKAQLLISYREVRSKSEMIKGQQVLVDDSKETFANEQHYFFQQVKLQSNDPVRSWLYEQEDGVSKAMDLLGENLVQSIQLSEKKYEDSIGGILQLYKNESNFYEKKIYFLLKKEEIRRFYRIIEDLEESEQVTDEWIAEYLQASEYSA